MAFLAALSDVSLVSAHTKGPESESGHDSATPSTQALQEQLAALAQELEQLRGQREHADRLAALGTLTATIAHEFNNLLTPSMNWAHLALRAFEVGKPDLELAQKALVKCHAAGQKAGRICESILNLSRAPDLSAQASGDCELVAAVDEALAALARDPAKDGITLRIEVPKSLRVAVSAIELEHVLINLLLNAQRAMSGRRGGTLTIQVTPQGPASANFVQLQITDTGCGIDAQDMPRIFDSFFTTRHGAAEGRGTGLGLSLCRTIVERHGGQISAQSAPGRGTTFTLMLPLARERNKLAA